MVSIMVSSENGKKVNIKSVRNLNSIMNITGHHLNVCILFTEKL